VIVMMRPRRSPSTSWPRRTRQSSSNAARSILPAGPVRIDSQQEQQFRPVDVSMPAITVWSSST
jgi:hypothetical protein